MTDGMAPRPIEVTIEAIGAGGDGIATTAQGRLFVPWTLPGERLRVRPAGGQRALPIEWLARDRARVPPACPHFERCGGCVAQHVPDSLYAAWKTGLARDAAARAGYPDTPIAPIAISPPRSRRRATLAAVRSATAGVVLGFHAPASRDVVDVIDCAVLVPALTSALEPLRAALRAVLRPGQRCDLALTAGEGGLDLLVVGEFAAPALLPLATLPGIVRVSLAATAGSGGEIVALHRMPRVTIDAIVVEPPPHAFLQATEPGQAAILSAVREGLGRSRRVADLFAGCGTLALPLARTAQVLAIDAESAALVALDAAARAAGLGPRVRTAVRDLMRRPLVESELEDFDAVVFDPPRDGAHAQAETLARSAVATVIAVSCNPATFARDAALLRAGGYLLEKLSPIDQFLWSSHLELVAIFRRPARGRRRPRQA
jgi:23S rRNA (uracil1939-C5)-methyltransferase